MQYFDFSRLIEKYKTEFKLLVPTEGYYDKTGSFVKGKVTEQTHYGAIIGLTQSKIFRSSGTLTGRDLHLFMTKKLDSALEGATVIHKGKQYRVQSEDENADFTGVYAYVLKYVDSFSEVKES